MKVIILKCDRCSSLDAKEYEYSDKLEIDHAGTEYFIWHKIDLCINCLNLFKKNKNIKINENFC